MKKNIYGILLLVLSLSAGYFSYKYLNNLWQLAGIFISGIGIGIFLMSLKVNVKNKVLSLYKRELEKESVTSDEYQAKVKVLESKIEVLEKALDNALKNK